MSYRRRNPYMTINHGLVGAKGGVGESNFILIDSMSEYSYSNIETFSFNDFRELQNHPVYNWYNLIKNWHNYFDMRSINMDVWQGAGLDTTDAYTNIEGVKFDSLEDPIDVLTGKINKGFWKRIQKKYEERPRNRQPWLSLTKYNQEIMRLADEEGIPTSGALMNNFLIDFNIEEWFNTPKEPGNIIYDVVESNDFTGYKYTAYSDVSASSARKKNWYGKHGERIKKIELKFPQKTIYTNSESWMDYEIYTSYGVSITPNEILLYCGTSYDETMTKCWLIKKL